MTKSAVKLVTLLVIFMYWWTPSQSVLNMCRNDTETEAVVHLYRLKRDDDPIGIDCHCTIRPLPGERVGMYFSASYIKGCQYSLTISHKTSTRYLNCNSNLNVIRFYYNIRGNDEITLGLTKHVSSATDGFDYSLKIEAARSKVLVRCYAAQSIPTTTRSSSTSTRPTTSAYTSQSRPVLTTILSTTPYRSTPPLSSTALFRSSTRSKTTYLVASQYKSTILTKSQESTTRLGISTLPSTSSRPRYKTSTPHGVNLPPWIETTDGRPTTTQDQYHNQSSTRDSTDNENIIIGVSLGCVVGSIVIVVLFVVVIHHIRKKKKMMKKKTSDDDIIYHSPHVYSNDIHIYADFGRETNLSRRTEEPSVSFHKVQD